MPTITAHDRKVQAAAYQGNGQRTEYAIEGCPGLVLAVHRPKQNGKCSKSWLFMYWMRRDGKRLSRKKSLGKYPAVTLRMAQRIALEMRDQIEQGIDVVGEQQQAKQKRQREQEKEQLERRTFTELVECYFEARRGEDLKSLPEIERAIRRDALPVIGHLAPGAISWRDIQACLDPIADNGKFGMARHHLSYLRTLFNYCLIVRPELGEDFGIEFNPTDRVGRRTRGGEGAYRKPEIKERALDDDEIKKFLAVLNSDSHETSKAIRDILLILLLTGQRTSEVREMPISELHLGGTKPTWRLPASRTKNRRPHVVPLTTDVLDVLQRHVGNRKRGPVFRVKENANGFIEARAPRRALTRLFRSECLVMEWFTPHDFRRTVETGFARLGVDGEVRDKCLNHVNGSVGAIHYNRHNYEVEVRQAFEKWASHCKKLAASP